MKYLCIPLLFLFSCRSTKPVALTAYEQEVYSALNAWLPAQDYIDPDEVVAQGLVAASEYEVSGLEEKGVSPEQAAEIYEQVKDTTVFKLDIKRVEGRYRWLPPEREQEMFKEGYYSGWEPLKAEYGVSSYRVISKPIFSADYTVAVIAVHIKNDWRTGSGGTYLLRKRNGIWQVHRIRMWIS